MKGNSRREVRPPVRWAVLAGLAVACAPACPGVAGEASVYLPVTEIAEGSQGSPAFTLVDVRDETAFAGRHVPGSVRMTLVQFKARSFYARRPVVLIDEGWGDAVLEQEVRRLRGAGYDRLFILAGGINAWVAAGQPTLGLAPYAAATQALSARDYLSVRSSGDWLVIDARPGVGTARNQVPALDFTVDPTVAAGRLHALADAREGFTRILVADAEGSGYAGIRRALAPPPQAVVFYLDGGWNALDRAERQADALRARAPRTVRSAAGATVPARLNVKPCGGCP